MKTKHLILACISFTAFAACTEKKETTIHENTTVEKDTVVVHEEKTSDPVIIEKDGDGTTINVDKDGVEFSTKSGDNSNEIELKDKK